MQTVRDGRQFLKYVDPRLGVPLPERDYGGNCLIYDADNKTDPFHNVWVRPGPGGGAGPGLCGGGPALPCAGCCWDPCHHVAGWTPMGGAPCCPPGWGVPSTRTTMLVRETLGGPWVLGVGAWRRQ